MMIRRLVPLCLLIACVFLIYQRLAFSGLILARGDAFGYFYPYWEVRSEAFRLGQLPLWSPDLFMGIPLLADPQVGAYYPPNWAVTPLAVPDAVRVSILAHVIFAAFGAYYLFRRTLPESSRWAALTAGILFGLGGFIGAHVEQVNQLQGLAWMPWLLAFLHDTLAAWMAQRTWRQRIRGLLALLLLAGGLAIQIYSGHTQTVFMSGVALGLYALIYGLTSQGQHFHAPTRLVRMSAAVILLGVAVVLAVLLAIPQLLPSMELTGLSIRGGHGFTAPQATAFSLPPTYLGRTLLPSYDGLLFGEYIGTVGIIGLGLMLWGIFAPNTQTWRRQRWAWVVMAGIGLFFAAGRYNPVYYTISEWPGFNLFRVPARWLALFSLGSAMLAGLGVQALLPLFDEKRKSTQRFAAHLTQAARLRLMLIVGALTLFVIATRFITIIDSGDIGGSLVPTTKTLLIWGAAGAALIGLFVLPLGRWRGALACLIVIVELWGASQIMPYNDLAPRDVYEQQRFTVSQLYAWRAGEVSVGRILPITRLYFDPGDKPVWDERFAELGMDLAAVDVGFTAIKKQEVVSANLPITWHIPSADGYGGGILPTMAYSQWVSLLMPDGMMRTVDGRLSEALAQAECHGACLPDEAALEAAGIDYLILDKTHDVWYNGIAYDTAFAGYDTSTHTTSAPFYTDSIYILYKGTRPELTLNGDAMTWEHLEDTPDGHISRVILSEPQILDQVTLSGTWDAESSLVGVTLYNARSKLFQQTVPQGWTRRLSSDIKIYTPPASQTRSAHEPYITFAPLILPDTWNGSEEAVRTHLRNDVIHDSSRSEPTSPLVPPRYTEGVKITAYSDTEMTITITDNPMQGYLIIKDAWYPGWTAQVNGASVPLYRANVMFRGVPVPAGDSTVTLSFQPTMWARALQIGGVMWAVWIICVIGLGVALRRIRS